MESLSLTHLCVLKSDVRTTGPSIQRWVGSRKAVKKQPSTVSSTQRILHHEDTLLQIPHLPTPQMHLYNLTIKAQNKVLKEFS